MQWREDLPQDWDEAPDDPPTVARTAVKLARLNDGYVLRPTVPPEEGTESSHSIYSTEIREVEPDPVEREG